MQIREYMRRLLVYTEAGIFIDQIAKFQMNNYYNFLKKIVFEILLPG